MPFQMTRSDGIVYFTLNTPNCGVNILDRPSAEQLRDLIPQLSPSDTRAVVFRSAKTESFINGVGLLMIQAARSREIIRSAGDFFRSAYQAVRDCRVPTIAAVRGNCWGCGTEFLLNCRYRIAADTSSSNFFMTEVVNYLLFPTFGGIHNLPAQVGLKNAINLILWGERWSSRRALEEGLIHELADHRKFDEAVGEFLTRVLEGRIVPYLPGQRRYSWTDDCESLVRQTQEKIRDLPPDYQDVYFNCLGEMIKALSQDRFGPEDEALLRSHEADSILSPAGKSAHPFFFILQIASQFPRVGTVSTTPARLTFNGQGAAFESFARNLGLQIVEGLVVTPLLGEEARFVVEPEGLEGGAPVEEIEVETRFGVQPFTPPSRALRLYQPSPELCPRYLELAGSDGTVEQSERVAAFLRKAGFTVVPTRTREAFGTDLLLRSFLGTSVAYLARGGDVRDLNLTLRQFGFTRRPHGLLEVLGVEPVLELLGGSQAELSGLSIPTALESLRIKEYEGGRWDQNLMDALTISWVSLARSAIREGVFVHPTLIDVAAREVIDFPLMQKSLCNWVSRSRVSEALARSIEIRSLVNSIDATIASEYAGGSRNFYS